MHESSLCFQYFQFIIEFSTNFSTFAVNPAQSNENFQEALWALTTFWLRRFQARNKVSGKSVLIKYMHKCSWFTGLPSILYFEKSFMKSIRWQTFHWRLPTNDKAKKFFWSWSRSCEFQLRKAFNLEFGDLPVFLATTCHLVVMFIERRNSQFIADSLEEEFGKNTLEMRNTFRRVGCHLWGVVFSKLQIRSKDFVKLSTIDKDKLQTSRRNLHLTTEILKRFHKPHIL